MWLKILKGVEQEVEKEAAVLIVEVEGVKAVVDKVVVQVGLEQLRVSVLRVGWTTVWVDQSIF